MPIKSCSLGGGKSGYQWGNHGKCYASREDAIKQMKAAYYNGYTGALDTSSADIAKLAVANYLKAKEILKGEHRDGIHALLLDKTQFTKEQAIAYATKHKFATDKLNDEHMHFVFVQADADYNDFNLIELEPGIDTLIGIL